MKLIIAEKPDAAKHIAANRGATQRGDGFISGNGYVITWAFGHLVELYEPHDYSPELKTWNLEQLPILPDFQFKVKESVTKQFKIIEKLVGECDQLINACDSDREGENIFWSIINKIGFKDFKNAKRLWFSDFTDESLSKAFNNLKPLTEFESLYKSAESRQLMDWVYGINLTRFLTCSAKNGLWNFGRVQTPTLGIVCKAYYSHHEFKEVPYWKVKIIATKSDINFNAISEISYNTLDEAKNVVSTIQTTIICDEKKVNEKNEPAPLLFSLSDLQRAASKKYGLKPHETLQAAQSLYEKHTLTSYPRSDSKYLPEAMIKDCKETLNQLQNATIDNNLINGIKAVNIEGLKGRMFNDSKVSSHHAIIPTKKSPDGINLSDSEQKIYNLILSRFVEVFLLPCKKETTILTFTSGKEKYISKGTIIKDMGWRIINNDIEEEEEPLLLPDVHEGEFINVIDKITEERKTQKPPLINGESLIRLMATAGKMVDNEEMAFAMKDNGLGTEATRAEIIKKLYDCGFIVDQNKSIIPTEDGLALYNLLKDHPISSAELTGIFEAKLSKVATGEISSPIFISELTQFLINAIEDLKKIDIQLESTSDKQQLLNVKCPKCKTGEIFIGKKTYACTNAQWEKQEDKLVNLGCDLLISKTIANKDLPVTAVVDMLTLGKSKVLKGFKNSEGKSFDAALVLKDFKLSFAFGTDAIDEKDRLKCPKCSNGTIITTEKNAFCSDYKSGCDFSIFRSIADKKLSDNHIKSLVKNGKTGIIKGFISKAKKEFDAELILNKESFKIEFKFPEKKK